MKTTSRPRKLAALLLALFGSQLAMASTASAAGGGLLGTGLFAPPPAPRPAAPAAAAEPVRPSVNDVEHKLASLTYDVGPLDGKADAQTSSAVLAFQKVHGMDRTGELTDALATQIMTSSGFPAPMVPNGEPNRVEVSLARQVLFLYEGGNLTKILAVATGTSATPTPTGTFRFNRFDPGWHTSRLGRLYNAEYFVGGYAIHGSLSVPATPASHGCIRISMYSAEWFPSHVHRGMQVVVIAG
ncbi:MAG TPA: L,D-transpeptidase family protein [Acidimicrobiales bacterium]|nr:L,D-transpeptidase family protein [Acidimicrobiales bacterium]